MKDFYVLVFLVFFLNSTTTTTQTMEREPRKKIVMLDSGVTLTYKTKRFLCNSGHRSFLKDRPWDIDNTGHGTNMLSIISEIIDPDHYCVVVYKTMDSGLARGESPAYAYAYALGTLAENKGADVLIVALEDVGYYYAEIDFYNEITQFADVFVAAGNDGIHLEPQNCEIFPACLKHELNLQAQKRFKVAGAKGFNTTSFGQNQYDPHLPNGTTGGTSYAVARMASYFTLKHSQNE